MIAGIGLPYAYDHFTEAEAPGGPPFICFLFTDSDNFAADDAVYQKILTLAIELYTDAKDPALEGRVEAALDDAELFYETHETRIDSENMYEVIYTTQVMITG